MLLTKEQELEIKRELYSSQKNLEMLATGSIDPAFFKITSTEKCSDGIHIGYHLLEEPEFNGSKLKPLELPDNTLRVSICGAIKFILEEKLQYLKGFDTPDLITLCNVLKTGQNDYTVII